MVIHQFNKLIRNKWVWGVFAIAISFFFAFDFLVADLGRDKNQDSATGVGTLAGEPVDAKVYQAVLDDVRGVGSQRDQNRKEHEINREAWENYAALTVAEKDGLEATDSDVQAVIRQERAFQQNGAFSFQRYSQLLRANGLTPERFEAQQKRAVSLMRIGRTVLGASAWASPMEVERSLADLTDSFTVKVAKFEQDKKDADAVVVDDAALQKWYDEHKKSLELPERIKIRYLKFNAEDPIILAKMSVSEDEIQDRFDVTVDKYTTKDTNGVEHVRTFAELTKEEKAAIEKELRLIAAVQYFETNLNNRAYGVKSVDGASRLDEIAKEDGIKVEISDWFAVDGSYQDGFMKRATSICPGANGFVEAVAELDPTSEDLRYAVVTSDKAVWLVEKSETSASHLPTFEEAKDAIRPRALRDAKADAFKKSVEAIAAKGVDHVLATKNVSTNIIFSVTDLQMGAVSFENQMAVVRAAMKLQKGEISDFVQTGVGKAILVVCVDRFEGDVSKAVFIKPQVRDELAMLQLRQTSGAWKKWNLDRMGFETSDISSVEAAETEE